VPTWLAIVIGVVLALVVVLAIGGAVAASRRRRDTAGEFAVEVDSADRALAAAHAADKGWERGRLEEAVREAWREHRPGEDIVALELVAVVDEPGTEDDKAVFRVEGGRGQTLLRLGREGGAWRFEGFE